MSRHRNRRPKPLLPVPADDVKHPPLSKWAARFALWYAEQPRQPTVAEQVAAASRLAGTAITYDVVKHTKRRRDWREVHDAMARGGVEAARAVLLNDLPTYMELHAWAAQRAKEKDDVRAMAQLTTPAMDRVISKRDEMILALTQPQTINIVVTDRQRLLEERGEIEITAERIPNEPSEEAPQLAPEVLPGDTVMSLTEAMRRRRQLEQPSPPVDLFGDD